MYNDNFILCRIQFQQPLNRSSLKEAYEHVLQINQKRGCSFWKTSPPQPTDTVSYSTDIGGSGWGLKLRIDLHLKPRLGKSGAVPPPPPHVIPYGAQISSTFSQRL